MEPNRHFNYERSTADQRIKAKYPKPLRVVFSLFMMLVFVFVGLMLLFNWFNVIYDPSWNLLRWIGGPVFILYGIYRAVRFYKTSGNDNA